MNMEPKGTLYGFYVEFIRMTVLYRRKDYMHGRIILAITPSDVLDISAVPFCLVMIRFARYRPSPLPSILPFFDDSAL